jgi:hypothetical protein
MTHMTARVERFVRTLKELSQAVEPKLHLISPTARHEWRAFQGAWLADGELRQGATELTEDQLEALMVKARRFTDIVHGLAPNGDSAPPERALDDETAVSGPLFVIES